MFIPNWDVFVLIRYFRRQIGGSSMQPWRPIH